MTDKRRADMLATMKLEKFTEYTKIEASELEDEVPEIRARGYALAIREEYLHVIGMAAPIRDVQGDVSSCLSVWTITDNSTPEQVERYAPYLIRAASDISSLSGWDPALQHGA